MLVVFLIIIVIVLILACVYFFMFQSYEQKNIVWGVNFSQMQAESLKLDWKKTYLAILEDLGVQKIKLITQWDFVEGNKQGDRYFKDIDWQVRQAELHGAQLMYVVGLKAGRWPECHAPGWAGALSEQEQKKALLEYITQIIGRYKDSKAIVAWQVENEPLFRFGECPSWYYDSSDFLKEEVALVKSLDPSRPVIISDSGEQSLWLNAARIGDKVGVTMYRKLWFKVVDGLGFYLTFPIPPIVYHYKAQVITSVFGKEVFCGELQAEPWASKLFYDVSLEEQEKSMNLQQFKSNVAYAKKSGLKEFSFWGVEWWYWLKEKHDRPEIWNEAKEIFKNSSN